MVGYTTYLIVVVYAHTHTHAPMSQLYCRASHSGDALRVGGVHGCQAEEFVLAAQV